jgi:hypothetical protein
MPKPNSSRRNKTTKAYSKAILKAAIKVKNCRKHSASDSDSSGSNDSSEEEPASNARPRRVRKKVKRADASADEEEDDEKEVVEVEVIDDEKPGEEEPEEERERHGDLEDRHRVGISLPLDVKKETTKDLLLIFSDLVVVKFKKKESYETIKGRWCLPCK